MAALRSFRPWLVLFAAFSIGACADSSGPDPGSDELEIVAPQVISRIGERLTVSARLGPLITDQPEISTVQEQRWLHDQPVFQQHSPTALVAHSAGRARVAVVAFGKVAEIDVVVIPEKPAVIASSVRGDTLTLRGYAMNRVARDSIGGVDILEFYSQDSATIRARFAPVADTACAGSSFLDLPLSVRGATIHTPLTISAPHPSAVSLGIGQAVRLPDGELCLRIHATPNAVYHLAYFDARALEWSRTRQMVSIAEPAFTFHARDGRPGGYGHSSRTARVQPAPAMIVAEAAHVNASRNQTVQRPLAAGDTFRSTTAWGRFPMTVVRVYDGHFVWAVRTSDLPRLTPAVRAFADSAFAFLARPVASFYDSIYRTPRPTSGNRDQLIINTTIFRTDSASVVLGYADLDGVDIWIPAEVDAADSPEGMMAVAAHEYAHVRDLNHQAANGGMMFENWAGEGLATFLAAEAMRRRYGLAFDANAEWVGRPLLQQNFGFFAEPHRFDGAINRGYERSSPVLRDFVMRLMDEGLTYDIAVREVTLGAAFGWFGCGSGDDCSRVGLAERMKQTMGAGWDPVDAILTFTLSQSADELVANADFRNGTFRRAGDSARNRTAFTPWVFNGYRGKVTFGTQAHTVKYFVIEGSEGGAIKFWDTPPNVKWMLLRVR